MDRLRLVTFSFAVGQSVEFEWNDNEWYPAFILALNADGSYDVSLVEEDVDPSLVQGHAEVGSYVELNWRGAGAWFPDYEVTSVNANGTYNLQLLQQGVEAERLREETPMTGEFNVDDSVEYFWGSNAYNEADRDMSLGAGVWNRTTKVVKVHQRPNDNVPVYDVDMSVLDAVAARITSCSGESEPEIAPGHMVNYQHDNGGQSYVFRVVQMNDDGTVHLVLRSKNVYASFLRYPPTEADRNPYLYAPPGWY